MRTIKKGATSQTVYVEILDSTSTTGGRKTGLVFNTSSLTGYYVRNGGSATAITLATLAAANSAWSSGGFKEVDATNMPGVYRLDVPDAAIATGAESVVFTLKGATGMAQVSLEVQLVDNTPGDVYTRLGAPIAASISADIQVIDDFVDTEVAAIKAKTDNLPSDPADASDIAGSFAMVNSTLSTIAGYIDTEVGAIKAKTDNLPASPAATSDIPTANQNADALLDRAAGVETGWTLRQAMRILLSALAGKASGLGTASAVFRDVGDSKNRITAGVDVDGNRTSVTLDAS